MNGSLLLVMMMATFNFLFFLLTLFAIGSSQVAVQKFGLKEAIGIKSTARSMKDYSLVSDYCDEELCIFEGESSPRKHIACYKINEFQSKCPPNLTFFIEFTKSEKKAILNLHNGVRNFVASGNHSLYNPAQRMAFMQWDKSLEFVSSFNVKRCEFGHDACRNTKKYRYSGQNLGIRTISQRALNRTEQFQHFQALIQMWINEGDLYCNQGFIDSFQPDPNPNAQIGHFTEMVRDENAFVGCSAIEYEEALNWNYLLACNYATNNFLDEPIYVSGKSCSACSSGCHKTYKALCSEHEQYQLDLH